MDVAGPEEAAPGQTPLDSPQREDHADGRCSCSSSASTSSCPNWPAPRKEFHQLSHLNFLWLILGALLEFAALVAYTQLTHTVLSPGAPDRWRIFRINMWALAISHTLPGGTVPGTAASYKLLTDADVSGSTAAFGLATQGIGSAVVLNVIFWLALLISIPLQGYNPLYGFAAILGVAPAGHLRRVGLLPHPRRAAGRRLREEGGRSCCPSSGPRP